MATTNKKIRTEIAKFTTSRDALLRHGHDIAVMILQHVAPKELNGDCAGTGDTTTLLELGAAMPSSWAEQLMAWAIKYTPMRFNVVNSKHGFDPEYKKLESKEDKLARWDYEGAINNPFYEAIKERAAVDPLDFDALVKMVESLSKRIAKKVEDGEVADADMASAEAMSKQLASLKFKRVKATNNNAPTPKKAAKTTKKAA